MIFLRSVVIRNALRTVKKKVVSNKIGKGSVSLDETSFIPSKGNRRSGGTYCHPLQGRRIKNRCGNLKPYVSAGNIIRDSTVFCSVYVVSLKSSEV
jgi:hypothetical protein